MFTIIDKQTFYHSSSNVILSVYGREESPF